jgi:hypothetical protein
MNDAAPPDEAVRASTNPGLIAKIPPRPAPAACSPACPVCGGRLVEIRAKLVCSQCRAICETCCEGGRG